MEFEPNENFAATEQDNLVSSDTFTIVKEAFHAWLSGFRSEKLTQENIVNTWDRVSEKLLRRKLSSVPLWEIINQDTFKALCKKVLRDESFRAADWETYYAFLNTKDLYLKFLQAKPVLHKAVASTADSPATSANARRGSAAVTTQEDEFASWLRAKTGVMACSERTIQNICTFLHCSPTSLKAPKTLCVDVFMECHDSESVKELYTNIARSTKGQKITDESSVFFLGIRRYAQFLESTKKNARCHKGHLDGTEIELENHRQQLSSADDSPSRSISCLTIKEAIIRVLETERHGLTVEQIYNKIVADGLYSFGAQNPQNVVRVEIDRACEHSNYAARASKDCFRFERNQKGEKIYFNLSENEHTNTAETTDTVNVVSTEQINNRPASIELWNNTIEQKFYVWLKSEYALTTARNYYSAANRTFQNFNPLAENAVREAKNLPEAIRRFIALLSQDGRFVAANNTAHNQLTAALSALERFYNSNNSTDVVKRSNIDNAIDDGLRAAVVSILEEHFPNGIRPNSVIDLGKLKNYYNKVTGKEIDSTDIPSLLNEIGTRHGEKVFTVSSSGKKVLTDLIDHLISEGNRLFYCEEFYETHADFLAENHIFSAELLKMVLLELRPSLYFRNGFFAVNSSVTAETEVLRQYAMAVCLSYEQLKEKLPYVPFEKIKQVLAMNSCFIWVAAGVYTHSSKIEVDDDEMRAVEGKIQTEIAEHGYTSITRMDVPASLELNPELSETAVKNGLFQVCLADRYEKRGNILTPKGTALNSAAVFEDYCQSHNSLTFDELLSFEKEINGSANSQLLFVAYDTMVRANKDTFVADNEIYFDIEAIDNALFLFVHTDVIPLRLVTSFTSFPYIDGYPWNWFLLESYCRRFSKQFKFQCLSVNSRNVGAIYRKSAGLADYADVLAVAVAAATVKLNEKDVGDFLFESGYVARRTGVISDVISKARMLRERRV